MFNMNWKANLIYFGFGLFLTLLIGIFFSDSIITMLFAGFWTAFGVVVQLLLWLLSR